MKILLTVGLALIAFGSQAQQGFSISGKVDPTHEGKKVMLSYYVDSGMTIKDSTYVREQAFSFQGKVEECVRAKLVLEDPTITGEMTTKQMVDLDAQEFYLENNSFIVSGSNVKDASITGGIAQADFRQLNSQLEPYKDEMKPLVYEMLRYLETKDKQGQDAIQPQLRALNQAMDKVRREFRESHPDSYVSLYILLDNGTQGNPDYMEVEFNKLSDDIRNSIKGKKARHELDAERIVDVGNRAIDFVQPDIKGRSVSLADYKGKYILLEFWASWCGPCRWENPNLIKAYNRLKGNNFEIVAVSLDSKKDAWLKAIEKDGVPWVHVSDLKGLKNEVALKYGVSAIPRNFLISPDGIIIAKDLRGEDMDQKLAELIEN